MRQSWLPWSLQNLRKDVNVFCSRFELSLHPVLRSISRLIVLKSFTCTDTFRDVVKMPSDQINLHTARVIREVTADFLKQKKGLASNGHLTYIIMFEIGHFVHTFLLKYSCKTIFFFV